MSDTNDSESADFDLSDVPMDTAEPDSGSAAPEGDEDEDEQETPEQAAAKAAAAEQAARDKLAPEELEKRYSNTRTALAEERRARRELERRLEALESGQTRQQPQRQAEPEEEIDPDVDPLGALRQMRAKIAAYESAARQAEQSDEERQQQERQFATVERALAEHEAEFREEQPDYDEAAKHYATARARELMSFGLAPAQIQPMLRKEFAELAATAINAKKNPAAVVYEMAKGRGFGKPADPKPNDPAKGAGKLDAVKRGQAAASPLGGAGGRATSGLDVTTVANINIRDPKGAEAFDKAFEALERRAKAAERR